MDIYATEAEQIELIKAWCKKQGWVLLLSFVLVLGTTITWRVWHQRHEKSLEKASVIYERLLNANANNNRPLMQLHVQRLLDHYQHTPYAQIAALMMAREAVYDGQFALAEQKLRWVMRHADHTALRQLARLRVARLLLSQQRPEEALALLQTTDDPAYLAASKAAMGDVLLVLGKTAEAREAYAEALHAAPNVEMLRPVLRMKLDDLATAATPAAAALITKK